MEIKEMTLEEIEARCEEIKEEIETSENIEELEKEVEELTERKKALVEAEEVEARAKEEREAKRQALLDVVARGEGKVIRNLYKEFETMDNTKTLDEVRSGKDYALAYIRDLRNGNDHECRALLTTNTTGEGLTGYVPVPTMLETEIKTAWEEHKVMGLLKHSYFKGNVKVGFELSATGANVHIEGTNAPNEEVITLGTVELKADNIKKWIRVSDEALEGTDVKVAEYIYKELAHRIVEKAEEVFVGIIKTASTTASTTAVGVPEVVVEEIGKDTILNALAELTSEASDLHILMTRKTFVAFRNLELNANYGIDVFEGLKDRIIHTDKLDNYVEGSGKTFAIIGDFGKGGQANFPNGEELKIIIDEKSEAEKDLVKFIGKQYVGLGLVGDKHFVKITATTSTSTAE